MRQSRFPEERIIAILREHEAGSKTGDVCRRYGISSSIFHKATYSGLDVSEARRLKVLTDENAKLKKLLAETMLDNAMLKDLNSKRMVTPAAKRQAVAPFFSQYEVSKRRGSSAIGVDRTSVHYRSRRSTTELSGQDCVSWQRRGGGLVIAVRFS
jgi:putative transposase